MSENWAEILLFIAVVAQLFCLTASVTSASRMMFAFSRDRAVPGHQLWRKVGRNRVPVNAVCAIGVLACDPHDPGDTGTPAIGYSSAPSIAVIGLYIAFILPVILRFRQGDQFEHGAWSLGNHYKWIDLVSIIWVAFISILFLGLPPYKGIPWKDGCQLGRRELRAAARWQARSCSSAAGGSSPRRTGSRARFAWARKQSSSCWRRSRRRTFDLPADTQYES